MPHFKTGWTGVSVSDLRVMYLECVIIVYKDLERDKV